MSVLGRVTYGTVSIFSGTKPEEIFSVRPEMIFYPLPTGTAPKSRTTLHRQNLFGLVPFGAVPGSQMLPVNLLLNIVERVFLRTSF